MRELTLLDCIEVSGGTNSSSKGSANQTCTDISGGAVQCTSTNGSTTITNTYDKNGNLSTTMVCTENSTIKLSIGVKKLGEFGGEKSGGRSCEIIRHQPRSGVPPIEDQLISVTPFTGAP